MTHERGKSDPAMVVEKSTNDTGQPAEELVESRAGPRGMRDGKARTGHRAG